MGNYATTTSLQILLPGVTFDTATTSLVSLCLDWGENYIKNALARNYNLAESPFVTFASLPPVLTSINEKLGAGYYFINASRGAKESLARGNNLIKDAKEELSFYITRKLDLVDADNNVVPRRTSSVVSTTTNYAPTFNEDNPLNWRVDRQKLRDIKSERGANG